MANHANSTTLPETNLVAVPFHGDSIITFEREGTRFVAMRRIVENMGLDWSSQRVKLAEQVSKYHCGDIATVDAQGRNYPMLCMPVEKLPLWLASINPNKIRDERTRAKVERYQAESAIALHDYWTKGVAARGGMDGVVTALDKNAMNAIGGMVKGIVNKALAQVVGELVEKRLAADPRVAVIGYVSVNQLLRDEWKVPAKGRRSIQRKVFLRLQAHCLQRGVKAFKSSINGTWVFPPHEASEFIKQNCANLIREHVAKVGGQGVLKLVRKPAPEDNAHA